MQRKLMYKAGAGLACVSLLAGCGDMNMNVKQLWPFGGNTAQERPRTPVNATEYQCAAGKRFFLRTLEGGAVWLILPEREFRLEKLGPDSATRYVKGNTVLDLNGSDATIKDGTVVSYTGCKTASSETK
jgi:hypothetical protein